MKGKTILVCMVILLILLSVSSVIAAGGPPSPPCAFYGYVNVGGKPARDGLNVTAVIIGTTLNWTTETKGGTYGWPAKGSSSFNITSQNTSDPERDGGEAGDVIQFYVQGVKINQTATFEPLQAYEFDLSISRIPRETVMFYGYVTVGGKPARDGLNVTAVIIGTTLNWTTETKDGTYGWPLKGSSSFNIPSQNTSDPERDGGEAGDVIQFYVQGVKINQTATFESGIAAEFDLSISRIPGEPVLEQPILTVSLNCSTTYVGYKVKISGELAYTNGTRIPEANLSLIYSVTGGTSWNNITSVTTTTNGNYSAEWMPPPTGNYLIKVNWEGNETQNAGGTEANASLAATQLEEKYVFSVVSNSTVSELAFNSASKVLSFTLSGPSGTTGYTNITIAKDLIGEITGLKVKLDENQINYITVSTDASWLLHFTYQHSTHSVTVSLGSPANSYPLYAAVIVIAIGICAVAIFLVHRKGHRTKATKRTLSK